MNLEKYKHISFDLDGTLVHTLSEYRYKIVPTVVAQLGGVIEGKHHIDEFWFGSDRSKTVERNFKVESTSFWEIFRKIDSASERSLHTEAYSDAEQGIRKLKEIGKIVSIITGAPKWIAEMEIAKLNGAPIDFYLPIAFSEFDEKPNPGSLNFVLKKLAMNAQNTLYIGNSNEDAHFAKNASVDFMYLNRKEHSFDLKDYAIKTINSLEELFIDKDEKNLV